jgi:hypothetical protein
MIAGTLTTMNIQTNAPPLVIDKSFAQAVSGARLSQLSSERTLLLPIAFYYEIITTERSKIRRTLVGLDEFRWVDKGNLLTEEKNNGEPYLSAELPRFFVDYDVLTSSLNPFAAESMAADQYKLESVDPFLSLWEEIMREGPVGFSTRELTAAFGSENDFIKLCQMLRDPLRIRIIAREIKVSHADRLDESWFTFRFIQAIFLQSLVLCRKYPDKHTRPNQERLEHDFHDMDYLTLGLHVKSLATADVSPKLNKASLGWRFKLLEPNYQLVVPSDELVPNPIKHL